MDTRNIKHTLKSLPGTRSIDIHFSMTKKNDYESNDEGAVNRHSSFEVRMENGSTWLTTKGS